MTTPPAQQPFRLGYRPALDGLRGVSILAVMFVHGGLFWMGQGGFLGVDIFFVLSGFLITALLVEEWRREGTISLKNFYARRALRLLPALLAVVALCLAIVFLFPPREGSAAAAKSILVALFYLSNWLPVYPPLFHTWSLGIEEQFYVVWPLLLFAMLRLRLSRRTMILLLIAGIVAIAFRRAELWGAFTGEARNNVYTRLDARADALLVGCVVGLLLSSGWLPTKPLALKLLRAGAVASAVCLACLIATIPSISPFLYYGGFTAVAVMVAVIIVNLFAAPLKLFSVGLEMPTLRWFGRLSYGLYLWHFPVYRLYDSLFPPFPIRSYTLRICIPFVIKFLASVAVASISFYLIEEPALRLKKHFAAVKTRPGDVRAAAHTSAAAVTPRGGAQVPEVAVTGDEW